MSLFEAVRTEFNKRNGKQISHHPELAGRVHVVSQQADRVTVTMDEYADWARVYSIYVWVRKAISKTAEQLSSKRVRVVDADNQEISGHIITQLFDNTNDTMSSAELWGTYVVNMLLAGEAPFEIVENGRGDPVEIWDRRPDKLSIIPDKSRPLFPAVFGYTWGDDDTIIDSTNMWMDKFYNPLNRWRGLAPIAAVRDGITIDLFAQAWSKKFLKDGARPDYAVIAPQGLTPSEREDYEQQFIQKFSGVDGWHRPIVLEEGITDIKPFSFAPKDIEWLEQRKFSRDEVAALFGMPDEIMGFGRDTYENFETAWRVWWLLTLKSLSDHRDNSLQSFFTRTRPILKPGQFIRTDLSDVGVLQDDIAPKVEMARELFSMGVPFNTLDNRLGLGIGEIPGGDVGYLRTGQPPYIVTDTLEVVRPPNPAEAPTEQRQPKIIYPKALEGWQKLAINTAKKGKRPARPFFDEEIPIAKSYELATVLGHCRNAAEVKAVFDEIDTYYNIKQILNDREEDQAGQLRDEREFIPEIEGFLQSQADRIFGQVSPTDPTPPDQGFWSEEDIALLALLAPFLEKWVENGVGVAASGLSAASLGLDALVNAEAAAWAGEFAGDLAKGLNATTRELARAKIANFIQSGKPLNELGDELAQIIGPRWRAELIAQTEVTRAYSEAVQRVSKEVDAVTAVIWYTRGDERVCPICGPLDGQSRKPGKSFDGFDGPPAHPRCRCWLGFEV